MIYIYQNFLYVFLKERKKEREKDCFMWLLDHLLLTTGYDFPAFVILIAPMIMGYDALFMFPKLVRCRFQQRHGCSCTVSDLHFSKLKSSSWLSSKGNTGEPAFNLFLHPDLTFSVSAPLIAASGAVQQLRKFWQQTIDMIFCLRVFQSIWCTIVSRL